MRRKIYKEVEYSVWRENRILPVKELHRKNSDFEKLNINVVEIWVQNKLEVVIQDKAHQRFALNGISHEKKTLCTFLLSWNSYNSINRENILDPT